MTPNGVHVTKQFIYSISPRSEEGHRVIVKIERKTNTIVSARINKIDMSINKIIKRINNDTKWFDRLPILEGSEMKESGFI